MPSLHSIAAVRLLQQVAPHAPRDRRTAVRTVDAGAVAARLVQAHDQVAGAVVGLLHRC